MVYNVSNVRLEKGFLQYGNLKQELKHKQGEICLLWFPRNVPILFPHVFDYDFVPGLEIN